MNNDKTFRGIVYCAAIAAFGISAALIFAEPVQSQQAATEQQSAPLRFIPLEWGCSIQLNTQSSGVEWASRTLHLLKLNSIQFELDKQSDHLKAEIQAEVMSFDNVDYDINAAIFDTTGELLGVARSQCQLQRVWRGLFKSGIKRTVKLDFGMSLDYPRATSFMVSISNRKVLMPNEW